MIAGAWKREVGMIETTVAALVPVGFLALLSGWIYYRRRASPVTPWLGLALLLYLPAVIAIGAAVEAAVS